MSSKDIIMGGEKDFLIVVDYSSDAERKRIDYAIERWSARVDVSKAKGTIIRFRDEDVDGFLDDLYSRLDKGKEGVRVLSAELYQPDVEEQLVTLRYVTVETEKNIKMALDAVLNHQNATYEGCHNNVHKYTVYSRKGQVGVDAAITPLENGTNQMVLILTGFGDAVTSTQKRVGAGLKALIGDIL